MMTVTLPIVVDARQLGRRTWGVLHSVVETILGLLVLDHDLGAQLRRVALEDLRASSKWSERAEVHASVCTGTVEDGNDMRADARLHACSTVEQCPGPEGYKLRVGVCSSRSKSPVLQ